MTATTSTSSDYNSYWSNPVGSTLVLNMQFDDLNPPIPELAKRIVKKYNITNKKSRLEILDEQLNKEAKK